MVCENEIVQVVGVCLTDVLSHTRRRERGQAIAVHIAKGSIGAVVASRHDKGTARPIGCAVKADFASNLSR
jgi:hypothetical protein